MRKLSWILIILLAFTLIVTGCGKKKEPTPTPVPTPSGPSAEDLAQGKKLFEQSCSACHGPDAKGLPGLGKDLTTSEFVKGMTDEELLGFIKKGRPASDPENTTGVDMPPKGGNPALTDEQIQVIIGYIRSLQE
ncbi:MAG: cytochrome c [Chloroflexi bacterium]|nr:cytochrome c [Chloroflexota bacterium]